MLHFRIFSAFPKSYAMFSYRKSLLKHKTFPKALKVSDGGVNMKDNNFSQMDSRDIKIILGVN